MNENPKFYLVHVTLELEAPSPEEAAQMYLRTMHHGWNEPVVCGVTEEKPGAKPHYVTIQTPWGAGDKPDDTPQATENLSPPLEPRRDTG